MQRISSCGTCLYPTRLERKKSKACLKYAWCKHWWLFRDSPTTVPTYFAQRRGIFPVDRRNLCFVPHGDACFTKKSALARFLPITNVKQCWLARTNNANSHSGWYRQYVKTLSYLQIYPLIRNVTNCAGCGHCVKTLSYLQIHRLARYVANCAVPWDGYVVSALQGTCKSHLKDDRQECTNWKQIYGWTAHVIAQHVRVLHSCGSCVREPIEKISSWRSVASCTSDLCSHSTAEHFNGRDLLSALKLFPVDLAAWYVTWTKGVSALWCNLLRSARFWPAHTKGGNTVSACKRVCRSAFEILRVESKFYWASRSDKTWVLPHLSLVAKFLLSPDRQYVSLFSKECWDADTEGHSSCNEGLSNV